MKNAPAKKEKEASDKNQQVNHDEKQKSGLAKFFGNFSITVTRATGSVYAFIVAIVVVIIWAATGPIFKYSDTWQLVINTGTTIITFLMVFIIQHAQNKDTIALQLKLNELIAASQASNKLIDVEDLNDEELEKLKNFYANLSSVTKKEKENKIHSIEEKKEEFSNVDSGKK
ncbi:MAG: low affinity iron permease family protein [Ginsengibacter sp.]